MPGDATRSALLKASTPPSKELFRDLITANHILHCRGVVDAYGHISVRNPQNPQTFFLARSCAPALISGRDNIEEYNVKDASPLDPNSPQGYAERFIHSEIYKRYKGVQSVVHAHAEAVLPFSIGSQPLRPVFHMAGGIGAQAPVFDAAQHYRSSDSQHDMLVDNEHLGAALAGGFAPETMMAKGANMLKSFVTSQQSEPPTSPSHPVVLMRGHGFTCTGDSIPDAVNRAVYTCVNARVQTTAMLMQGSYNISLLGERFGAGEKESGPAKREDVKYLSDREAKDAGSRMKGTVARPWEMWSAEVAHSDLYQNDLDDPEEEG